MKTKTKKSKFELIGILTTATAVCYLLIFIGNGAIKTYKFIKNPVPAYAMTEVNVPRIEKKTEVKEPTMKEYIKAEVIKAGLDWKKFDCLIRHESNYNQYAINKNKNGTYDLGIMQVNDVHNISREDRFDYKKSTQWAIKKIKKDGNYNAWYGFRNGCI